MTNITIPRQILEQALDFIASHGWHPDSCTVFELDERGKEMGCSCGRNKIVNALTAARSQAETVEPQPVATLHDDGYFTWKHNDLRLKYHSPYAGWRMDVYAGPVAQQPQRNGFVPPDAKIEPDLAALYAVPDGAQQPQEPRKPLYARRPSLWAMDAREALELIAAPMRPDGTWNRDRLACQQLAQEVLGKDDDA